MFNLRRYNQKPLEVCMFNLRKYKQSNNPFNLKISQNVKKHLDPWEMTLDEILSYSPPEYVAKNDYILGFHGTPNDNIDSILSYGISLNFAQGRNYNEPEWIWAYSNLEIAKKERKATFIIFQIPKQNAEFVNEFWFRSMQNIPSKDILGVEKYYFIRTDGFYFSFYLEDFKNRDHPEFWHRYCIEFALENGLTVPNKVMNEFESYFSEYQKDENKF